MGVAVRLHHQVSGQPGQPTVVVGGSLGSTLASWEPQLAALSAPFQVIAYDHRGHGGSPAPPGPYRVEDLARDVLALLDEHQVPRAHVVGLSLGGMVAQVIAAQQPQRVDRLVLMCTSAHSDRQSWTERAATVRASGTAAIADAAVGRWLTSDYGGAHPDVTAGLREMIVSIDDEGYAGCCDAIADMDLRPGLARIEAPTLVLAGAEDPAMPPDQMREMAGSIAGSRFVVVPGAHVPPIEHPEVVTRLLLEHLAGE